MLLAMAEDIRVVLIKLADRLHNMRTLYGLPSEKQQRIARQTMEIYAPLAERLGIWQIKWELEDLAFKALEPERFRELAKLLDTRRKGRETLHRAGDRRAATRASRRPASTPTSRAGRSTSTASGRRCSARARSSARSTTSTPSACSSTRSATATRRSASSTRSGGRSRASSTTTSRSPRTTCTSRSTPRSSRSTASRSRSRSGPTRCTRCPRSASPPTGATRKAPSPTASTTPSSPGCASSWTGSATSPSRTRPSSSRASSSTSSRTRSSCSRPKGDIKDLPAGATPLDFAYRIHTDVGHRTIGAKVNNRLVPLDYRLKNGDIVEIVTTKGEHGPSRDWLNVVRTSHAREKIRQWFKRKDRDENIVHGRESLERELRRLARTSIAAVGQDQIAEVAQAATTTSRSTTSTRRSATARSAPQAVVMRLGVVDDGQSTLPTVAPPQQLDADRRRPGQGRRRPARPLRQVLPPDPGRPDRRVHHPRQGRDGPPPDLSDGRQRARGQPADRRRVGGRADPDATRSRSASRPTTGPACSATSPRSWPRTRSTSWPPHVGVTPDHTAVVTATLQVASVSQLARVMSRIETPQGRHQRPARPRLTRAGAPNPAARRG